MERCSLSALIVLLGPMGIFLALLYTALFCLVVWKVKAFRIPYFTPRAVLMVFILKLLSGAALALIYNYVYEDRRTGDTYRFFDDSQVVYESLKTNPGHYFKLVTGIQIDDPALTPYFRKMTHWERSYSYGVPNDNATMIRANALISLFSFGHYPVHVVFLCFLSLAGLTALFRALAPYFPDRSRLVFLAVYLMPSVLFWASGVLKEALHFAFFGPFILATIDLYKRGLRMDRLVVFALFFLALLWLKGYALFALGPALLTLWILHRYGMNWFWLKVTGVHLASAALVFSLKYIFSDYNVLYMMQLKQGDFFNVALNSGAGSVIEIPRFHSLGEFILQSPIALTNALFRPFIHEIKGVFFLLAGLENLVVLGSLVLMVFFFRPPSRHTWPVLMLAISFSLILLILLGSLVPVMGALVRYKVPALPFVMFAIFAFLDLTRLEKRFPALMRYFHP